MFSASTFIFTVSSSPAPWSDPCSWGKAPFSPGAHLSPCLFKTLPIQGIAENGLGFKSLRWSFWFAISLFPGAFGQERESSTEAAQRVHGKRPSPEGTSCAQAACPEEALKGCGCTAPSQPRSCQVCFEPALKGTGKHRL